MSATPLIAQLAAYGLPARARAADTRAAPPAPQPLAPQPHAPQPLAPQPLAPQPLAATEWSTLLAQARRLRISGLLQAAIADGALPATDEQRHQAHELHLSFCVTALMLERTLLEVTSRLERAGIDVIVLKGSAHAHLLYPDPSLRMFGDNDLLFRSGQIDDALALLADAGYRRPKAAPRPDYDRRFGKGATLVGPDGAELDVHRTLLFGSFGLTVDNDELFASAVTFRLGGRELRALGPDTGVLHACYHAALGDPTPRLGSLRDVAQRFALARHDPDRVRQLIRSWRAAPVVARALQLCDEQLGVTIDDPAVIGLHTYRPSRREQRAVASYVGVNRSHAAKVVASLPYLSGPRAKAAFLRANLAPSATFVRTRGGRPGLAWLERGMRSLAKASGTAVRASRPAPARDPSAPARVLWLTKGLGLGGAERLLTSVAAGIDRDRFEVEVAYLLPWKDAFAAELERHGVRTVCLGARRTLDPLWVWRLARLLRERRYELVHTHSPVPAVAARLLARSGTTLVHTEHNVWDRYRWPTYAVNAVTYARNDAVIAVSDAVAASIAPPRWLPGTAPSVETLLHGIDLAIIPRGPEARDAARARLGIAADAPVVGTVANFTPKKDHAGLLTAIAKVREHVPGVVLLLIGSGPLEAELRDRVATEGLQGTVRFLGSRDDVPALLPALDVFVLGSRFEGLPISLLEAMAAEVACVATSVGGIPEAITDHREGRLVAPGDPAALADAIAATLADDDARARMAAAGLARVTAEFSIERAVLRTQALYAALLHRPDAR